MFGQCLIFVYLGLRSILMLCEQAKMGEDVVLAEYLQLILNLYPYKSNNYRNYRENGNAPSTLLC